VNRREFVAIAGGALSWPFVACAQQKTMPVIGYLSSGASATDASNVAAFRQGLSETGYVEGRNVVIEYRWADGHYDRLPVLATDLVSRKVDVISSWGTPAALAAKRATLTIPVVFAGVGDAVGAGLVASLARPGGNLTGVSLLAPELVPKLIELLSELVPQAKVIALLTNPTTAPDPVIRNLVQEVGHAKELQLPIKNASTEEEIDTAFTAFAQLQARGLVVVPDGFFGTRREQLVALASRHAVPTIFMWREFSASGGLISYGASPVAASRQVGLYTGRILTGEKPADLPVQQPTKFELVINLKTAKTLGLAVPQSLLGRADEVIE
jgi:putative ABC transport system substrate-binding protein